MKSFVVDTNVAVVANGRSPQAGIACVYRCIDALEEVINKGILVIDDHHLILHEYMQSLSLSGQPGPGDGFLKWVWTVQSTKRVIKARVTPDKDDSCEIAEFPRNTSLRLFDREDRKFVAAVLCCRRRPPVLNAVDSDWWRFRVPLKKHGVKVVFLCPEQSQE